MAGDEKLRIKEHHLSGLIGSSRAMLPLCNSEAKPSKPVRSCLSFFKTSVYVFPKKRISCFFEKKSRMYEILNEVYL